MGKRVRDGMFFREIIPIPLTNIPLTHRLRVFAWAHLKFWDPQIAQIYADKRGKSHPKKEEVGKVFKLGKGGSAVAAASLTSGILAGGTPAVPGDADSRAFLCVKRRHLRITGPVE